MDCVGEESCPDDVSSRHRCDHKLLDIILIAICAVLSGAETWDEVEEFGEVKERWLKQFLDLPNGIPSHDTFRRVFRVKREQVIAVDGKSVRRSHHRSANQDYLHLVGAWATANGITLGQRKVEAGENEIVAIPELLRHLYLKGCIVTIDAIGCQMEMAQQIVDQHADYVLALKANQGRLHQDVVEWFAWAWQQDFRQVEHTYHQTFTKGHGRIEIRRVGR